MLQVGCEFCVVPSDFCENNSLDLAPDALAKMHAREKALAVAAGQPAGEVVIGADTIVALEGKVYGKPLDRADAVRMLSALAGRTHVVYTGVAVVRDTDVYEAVAATRVTVRLLGQAEIEAYVNTGEPLDKAGAYAIQGRGALLVERIEGCYPNVVGLPLTTLAELLEKAGVHL